MLHRDRDPDKPHSLFMSLTLKPLFDDQDNGLDMHNPLCYDVRMNIGEQVRKRREELGLSKAELSRMCKVHRNTISNIESGSTSPSYSNLIALERSLGIHLHHKEEQNEDRNESPAPR